MNPGAVYAFLAYAMWGTFPLYFRLVASVAPLEIMLHRSVWSLAFLAMVLTMLRRWSWLGEAVREPRRLALALLGALLLSGNWLLYIWAVNNDRVIDSSLGYFINPLVNVVLGFAVLGERLRRLQRVAVAIAATGVVWLTWQAGQLPWIALVLAGSFGLYGLLRKTAPLGAMEGLTLETLLLLPLAAPLLAWFTFAGDGALARGEPTLVAWLLVAGPLTAIPLVLFAAGARRVTLATLGLLQYVGPTIQFGLGVWVFNEPFGLDRLFGFSLIWLALAVYSGEGWWMWRDTGRRAV
jgi:chloramphenicol-sensitive protein RarD